MDSLYSQLKRDDPRKFRVDPHGSLDSRYGDSEELSVNHPCYGCVVRDCRSPEHCDPCPDNPDRERMKRSGML